MGALTAAASLAAAAAVTLSPNGQSGKVASSAAPQPETGAPVMVVVPARLSLGVKETVPRLVMLPASVADGPVHGLFSTPVAIRV